MSAALDEITNAALTMPDHERAALAAILLDSLEDHTDRQADINSAWTSEIHSRVDDIVSGRVQTLSRDQVDASIAASLAASRR